jgi:ABC-2 type transport system ATP-binding protein
MDGLAVDAIRENSLVNAVNVLEQKVMIPATNGSSLLQALLAIFGQSSIPIISISIRTPSLEDIFIFLTGKKLSSGSEGGPSTGPCGGRPS